MTDAHVEAWLRAFLGEINAWETHVSSAYNELGTDSQLTGGDHGDWWHGMAQELVHQGVPLLQAWLQSRRPGY